MFLSSIRWSFIAASAFISLCVAHGSHKVRRTASGTSSLLNAIPACAFTCVESFILSDYPTNACAPFDLHCLCRTNTKSGYTLGEAGLRCNLSHCSMNVTESSHVYSICNSVPGAIPKTHATITATITSTIYPTTETTSETTTRSETYNPKVTALSSVPTSSQPQITPSATSTTLASFQSPLMVTHTEQPSPSSTSSQPVSQTAPVTASATATGSSLNAAAVIGVSVTSGVSGFFILGVIIFFCCRRVRRHQRIKDRDFFEIGGVMSEPPDFGLPLPRRPTEGPGDASSSTASGHSDSETARLMRPPKPTARNPAVIVTSPEDHHFAYDRPGRIGFAVSTNSEFDASPSQESQRTISDLLPDKPNLYPEPLRWSTHKSRPISNGMLSEEDTAKPQSLLGSSNTYAGLAGVKSRPSDVPQYKQNPLMGLPPNPRAMLYGTEGARSVPSPKTSAGYGAKPVYANSGERIQHWQQAEICSDRRSYSQVQMPNQQDYVGNNWLNSDNSYAGRWLRRIQQQSTQGPGSASPSLGNPGAGFETIHIHEDSTPRRKSRHSGDFKPLTPVKETDFPSSNARRGSDGKGGYIAETARVQFQYPRMPFSATPPLQEIVSRPRIVRRDDIKRVQIRKGKPQPEKSRTPYSPDDCWVTPVRDSQRQSPDPKPRILSVDPSYPVEKMAMTPRALQRKPVSWGRNLTPSKRGSDLILRVD